MFADIRQFVELTDGTCNAVPGWEVTWEPQVGALCEPVRAVSK